MHNKILLLDHDNGLLNLADDIMYYGYTDLYICSDYKLMPEQAIMVKPDLIIWDCLQLTREEAEVYKSLKCNPKLAGVPVIIVSAFLSKYLSSEIESTDVLMLKPFTTDELSAKMEYLLAS